MTKITKKFRPLLKPQKAHEALLLLHYEILHLHAEIESFGHNQKPENHKKLLEALSLKGEIYKKINTLLRVQNELCNTLGQRINHNLVDLLPRKMLETSIEQLQFYKNEETVKQLTPFAAENLRNMQDVALLTLGKTGLKSAQDILIHLIDKPNLFSPCLNAIEQSKALVRIEEYLVKKLEKSIYQSTREHQIMNALAKIGSNRSIEAIMERITDFYYYDQIQIFGEHKAINAIKNLKSILVSTHSPPTAIRHTFKALAKIGVEETKKITKKDFLEMERKGSEVLEDLKTDPEFKKDYDDVIEKLS